MRERAKKGGREARGADGPSEEALGASSSSEELPVPARGGARSTASSLKERMRQARREAYQRAKAWRAQDPRQIALKEAAKLRHREQYQQVKQRRKEALSATRAAESARRAQAESDARSAFQAGRVKAAPLERLNALVAELQAAAQKDPEVANDVS
jgi:hypothetical protein